MLKKIWISALGTFFSMNIFAITSFYDEEYNTEWQPIITLSGGPAWASPGQNQYLYPIGIIPPFPLIEHFVYNSPTGILASGELFFGLQHLVQPCLISELGIGLAGATDAKATGVINANGIPEVTTFGYKVDHGRAEFKGRLISTYFNRVQPYISGSFGAGFNNSHAYVPNMTSRAFFPADWYESNTTIAFSYTLGAGIQTRLSPHWQVGIGYEFADWGKNFLGPDPVTLDNGPGLTHLYVNELLFSLSYLF